MRIVATSAGDKVIFKGGTSLSKGWNLIQRFSEDIDILLDPMAFAPALTKRGIDRELKKLRDAVIGHPGLQFIPDEGQTIGALGAMTGSRIASCMAVQANSRIVCCSKREQRAAASPPRA